MKIKQGELYWIDLGEPSGSAPGFRHPHIVVQNDLFNYSNINTTVVCTLTANMHRSNAPGNVLLPSGEGNLTKPSVVNVSQIYTVDKRDLVERIGKVSEEKLLDVLVGIELLIGPRNV
jgi:mRNA interferase MazF